MEFWKVNPSDPSPVAIEASTGRQWSYADLHEDMRRIEDALPRLGRKTLGLLLAQNRYECMAAYLAALNAGSALIVLDASLNPGLLQNFLAAYRPDWIYALAPELTFERYVRAAPGLFLNESPLNIEIHPDLALLLNTSGSTGSPKLVRLTLRNLSANADSIAQYLQLTSVERPITSLPFSYSYGLSVVNSHLRAGACIVFTEDGVLRREFWDAADRFRCTSFAGVPYTYQLLLRTGLLTKKGSSLTMLTQAGGRLDELYIRQMHEVAIARRWKFIVMYGQTEAAPRISYLPFEELGRRVGSIGIAVPNGALAIDSDTGELIYRGENVMMGYAEHLSDLAKGDEMHGLLRTGDLARQDDDGYYYLTGRLRRFLKLFGKRFSLDETETILSARLGLPVACFGRDDFLTIAVQNEGDGNAESICRLVGELFDLPRTAVTVTLLREFPRTANGKPDYRRLATTN